MCLHIIVHVYLYNYDKMFIDKLQIVLKSLLTCKIHKSALEYSIIRRYTNVVYYYIIIIDMPLNEWMIDDILTLKAIRRKHELIWRKTRTTINFDIYYDSCKAVKEAISKRKSELMEQRVG